MGCVVSPKLFKSTHSSKLYCDEKSREPSDFRVKPLNRILLLGTGGSGKSTLRKQIESKYTHGFSESERIKFKRTILENLQEAVQKILIWSDLLPEYGVFGTRIAKKLGNVKEFLLEHKFGDYLKKDTANKIKQLWNSDKGFIKTFTHSSMYSLPCCIEYFLDNLDRIAGEGYIPSKKDIYYCSSPTEGSVEIDFEIENEMFKVIDMGGARCQRKNWVHYTSNIAAVIFMAAINEYDLPLTEDENKNRLDESLDLFQGLCNGCYFRPKMVMLVLNKTDIFETKIDKFPLSPIFKDYKGKEGDFKEALHFIGSKFENRVAEKKVSFLMQKANVTLPEDALKIFDTVVNKILERDL